MKVEFFIPRWGNRHMSWAEFCAKAKHAGYAGVEANLSADPIEQHEMFEALAANDLYWIGQHFETMTPDFDLHLEQYQTQLYALAAAKPILINSQTGKDYFSFEQNSLLIEQASRISTETGVLILHETHRGKFSFCTTATSAYLIKYPELQITADFSHWCCVAESFLQDQQEVMNLAISRAAHFHARVGFPGGPQVNDPAAPEWTEALAFHYQWWDAIVQTQQDKGTKRLTVTCEFGPFPYMPQLPVTKTDVSDLWQANLFIKNYLEQRYLRILQHP